MTVLDELRTTGCPGPETAQLVYETTRAVVRFRNFPPPEGHQDWTSPAITELAHDFVADERTPKRWVALAARATDDDELGRLLNTSIVNYLRDRGRRTDRGHLMARIRDVLGQAPDRFSALPATQLGEEHWALVTTADASPWQGRLQDLVREAWRVDDLTLVSWDHAQRRGPIADRESWQRLAEAVLGYAAGPVATKSLAEVAEHRFSLQPRPDDVSIDGVDVDPPAASEPQLSDQTDLTEPVARMWPHLTERERLVLAHHDVTIRELAGVLGLGKSAAGDARAKTLARLGALLASTDLHGEVLDEVEREEATLTLVDTCNRWVQERTFAGGSPSHQ